MELVVFSLDPGVTTGYAIGVVKDVDDERTVMGVSANQARMNCLELWTQMIEIKPDKIICESFEFRQHKQVPGLELYSRNLIGVVQLYSEMFADEVTLYMQTASKGKGYFNNDKLKEHEMYIKGKEHARDAIRHLLHWINFGAGYSLGIQEYALAST